MKRLIFMYVFALVGLYSCDYDKDVLEYKPDIIGGPVSGIYVSPSSMTLYVDSELPTMTYTLAPLGTADTLVTWVSDKPEVLAVDQKTGELSWGSPANTEVKISAISNNNQNIMGSCVFTIRNVRGMYGYVDLRRVCNIWMIDRGLGAQGVSSTWNFASAQETIGDYYQWGKSEPVANLIKGGEDGVGGYWNYSTGYRMKGGYENYDIYWTSASTGFLNWSSVDNQPGGWEGWRLPTKEELEKVAYYMNPDNFRTAMEKGLAEQLRASLYWRATGMISYVRSGHADYDYAYQYYGNPDVGSCYIWSSDMDPEKPNWAYALEITASGAAVVSQPVWAACPVRLVCEAENFDESWVEEGDKDEDGEEGEEGSEGESESENQ